MSGLVAGHRRTVRTRLIVIGALVLAAVASFLAGTVIGAIEIPVREVLVGLVNPGSLSPENRVVLWNLRLPMAVMAVLVGIGLSLAGAEMQTILANPLAEPFTLGVSAAAAFGAAFSVVAGVHLLPNPQTDIALAAWVAAMVATAVIVAAAVVRGASAETMILLGIGLVFLFQAALALMKYRASTEALSQIVFWSMGSMTRASWAANAVLAVVIALALPLFMALSWQLTALRLGDARAAAMGVNVSRLRVVTLVVVSIVAATTVAFCGVIGFVGLVGPHVARMLVGEDQRYFLPASMAAGAVTVCLSHAVSMLIHPGVAVPIGIVTAIVGVPFFVTVVLTRRRRMW